MPDRTLAAARALGVLQTGVRHPGVLAQVFRAFNAEGRPRVTAADAGEVLGRYGGLLGRQGLLDDARAALEASLIIAPESYVARIDAGTVNFMLANLGTAEAHYAAASALRPDEIEPIAARAAIAARRSDAIAARDLGARALAIDAGNFTASLALARAELLLGDAAASIARLDELLARTNLNPQNRVAALDLRAEVHDANADCAAAFGDYSARNALLRAAHAPQIARDLTERRSAQARRLATWFDATDAAPWQVRTTVSAPSSPPNHVFLLGFPRSGTTLLEKALAGHPAVVTLEEVDHLAAVSGGWLAGDVALNRLATLDTVSADAARAEYWRRVVESVPGGITGRTVIDKLPLHSVALPVIAKLFPDARILLALRDPRDVVLSCFRRRFQINAAMFEFLTLEGAANYYDQVMRLVARCRAVMPISLREVRHEALVSNFDDELGAVLAFLDLDWDPAVRDFAARIGDRFRTPSDVQLKAGLSDAGIGQWRRYASELAPVQPVLARWVSAFGYPA